MDNLRLFEKSVADKDYQLSDGTTVPGIPKIELRVKQNLLNANFEEGRTPTKDETKKKVMNMERALESSVCTANIGITMC